MTAAARCQAEAAKASESVEQAGQPTPTTKEGEREQLIAEEADLTTVKEGVVKIPDEFCPNDEYGDEPKIGDLEEPADTIIYDLECWDPDNKWEVQDVYNHMGEAMFRVFDTKSEDQQYQLTVNDKVDETFKFKLEMKNFKNSEKIVNNFRRQGYVPGGGCVKFFRKYL